MSTTGTAPLMMKNFYWAFAFVFFDLARYTMLYRGWVLVPLVRPRGRVGCVLSGGRPWAGTPFFRTDRWGAAVGG